MNKKRLVFLVYNIIFEHNTHDIKSCLLINADNILKDLDSENIKSENNEDYIEYKIAEKIGYHYKNFFCLQDFKYSLYSYNVNSKEMKFCPKEEWYGRLKF